MKYSFLSKDQHPGHDFVVFFVKILPWEEPGTGYTGSLCIISYNSM